MKAVLGVAGARPKPSLYLQYFARILTNPLGPVGPRPALCSCNGRWSLFLVFSSQRHREKGEIPMRIRFSLVLVALVGSVVSHQTVAHQLSIEERVAAQRAIEEVRFAHR